MGYKRGVVAADLVVETSRLGCGSTSLPRIDDANERRPVFGRDRQHVSGRDLLGGRVDPLPVDPYIPAFDEFRGEGTGHLSRRCRPSRIAQSK